jgi:RNA polymerase sigma-B factor
MLEDPIRREQTDLRLLRRYHEHNDVDAREQMVRRGLPLVRSLARPYSGRGEQFDDLVQVGSVGLVKAIDRFDPDTGTRFVAFAAPTITGEIKRHFRDHCWMVHVPRSVQELDVKVNRAAEQMAAVSGRTPTIAEISVRLKEPVERVADAIQGGQGYRSLSLDHPAGETRETLETLGEEDAAFANVERRQVIVDACQALDEREREIVMLRYFDGLLQREIAEKIGVSQMQVSRILTRALERMREYLVVRDAEEVARLAA